MARTDWNPSGPDIRGVEFLGVGAVGHPVYSKENWRALTFTAQRSGEVDEIALYSGPLTVNPVLSPLFFRGHRAPYVVELYTAAAFGYGGTHTITTYTSTMTSSAFVVDESGTAPENNELAAANDDLFLAQSGGGLATATVHMPSASAFPLDQQVMSIAIEHNFLRQMRVRRIDQTNGTVYWERLLPAGGVANWHIGEAFIESADPANWRLWTPTDVRQFASAVGNRRLQVTSLNKNQAQIIDLLRIHVDHVPEERIGVGVFEPSTIEGWVTIPFHTPTATGTPATIVSGTEYVLVIRSPHASSDYQTLTRFDQRAVPDLRTSNGGFSHFTHLDWDLHAITTWTDGTPKELGALVDGLPAIRLINNGAQTVDTQPYERTLGARVSDGLNAVQNDVDRVSAVLEYGQVQFLASTALGPMEDLTVTVQTIGSFTATVDEVDASPLVGVDELGHEYRHVTVPFGSGTVIGADPFDITFTSSTPTDNPWLISCLAASSTPGTGNQTFEDGTSFASGTALDPRDDVLKTIATYGTGDLQVALISQPAELVNLTSVTLNQPVSGMGACEPCGPENPLGCTVLSIPYPQISWNHSELDVTDFVHYELQRREYGGDYTTVAVLGTDLATQTTGPVSGSGIPNHWDDWSLPYDSPVSYRVRQRRMDGAESDWSTSITVMVPMAPGADLVITNPTHPELNVAYPESHSGRQITHPWESLDSGQITYRAMYNRDGQVMFRPTERLGMRFTRPLLLSALCTTITEPSLDSLQAVLDLIASPGSHLVVRDGEHNRWYAGIRLVNVLQTIDEHLGAIWTGDIEVTEVSAPILDISDDSGGHHA